MRVAESKQQIEALAMLREGHPSTGGIAKRHRPSAVW